MRSIGQHYENQACTFLQQQGLRLIKRNFACRLGEIDLIMQEKKSLVFVEVRYRRSHSFGDGIESIEYRKCKKLIRTAEYYLQQNRLTEKIPCRFDVIGITHVSSDNSLTWIKDAFQIE
jgi:putative endonuclease